MIENTISEIESKIRAAEMLGAERQHELLELLARLKAEVCERDVQSLQPLKLSVEELRTSVEGFEQSHPKLVQAVNGISSTLANLGI